MPALVLHEGAAAKQQQSKSVRGIDCLSIVGGAVSDGNCVGRFRR